MKYNITNLPQDIYGIIAEYTNIIHLINTSSVFKDIKYKYVMWSLKLSDTHKYYKNEKFRELILSKMTNPLKQLKLILNAEYLAKIYFNKKFNMAILGNAHTLILNDCKNIIGSRDL